MEYDQKGVRYEETRNKLLERGYSVRWLSRVLGVPRWKVKKALRGQLRNLRVELALKVLLGRRGDGEASQA